MSWAAQVLRQRWKTMEPRLRADGYDLQLLGSSNREDLRWELEFYASFDHLRSQLVDVQVRSVVAVMAKEYGCGHVRS